MKLMKKHLHVFYELTKANEINNFNKQFGAHYVSAECGQALDINTTVAESDRFKIDPKPWKNRILLCNVNKATSSVLIAILIVFQKVYLRHLQRK